MNFPVRSIRLWIVFVLFPFAAGIAILIFFRNLSSCLNLGSLEDKLRARASFALRKDNAMLTRSLAENL